MAVEKLLERWNGVINEVSLGAVKADGGSRCCSIKTGGETALPFIHEEGGIPNRPVLAMEVLDTRPEGYPDALSQALNEVLDDAAAWAKKCQDEFGADLICLKLTGAHPDNKDTSVDDTVKTVMTVKEACSLPLIIWGCGNNEKDNQILPACSQALKGEKVLLGSAVQDNYKTLAATCIADGHSVVAESPLDINISKQVNILLSDMDLPLDRIVIYPTSGALGYGFEYAYSIMERTRLAALGGDKTMAMPMLAMVGSESWRAKEAKASVEQFPQWGPELERGIAWETSTAVGYLMAGADILTICHPKTVKLVKAYIETLTKK